jgi:hypothetical protein
MKEIVFEEDVQIAVVFFLELIYLALEQLFGFLDYFVQLIELFADVVGVDPFYVVAKLLDLHIDELADLVHFGLELHQSWIIYYVLLHLLVFAGAHGLKPSQPHPRQPQSLLAGLSPVQLLVYVSLVLSLALLAQFSVVVTAGGAAYRNNRKPMGCASVPLLIALHSCGLQLYLQL